MITIDPLNNMLEDTTVKIRQAVEKLELTFTNEKIEQWVAYLHLLKKWNKTYNITSITDWNEMLCKHLFDSLSASSFLEGDNIIDVGSGGGLPGIPLAILMPEKKFTLVDSSGKKVRFLNYAKRTLMLSNVTALDMRIESYQPKIHFDTVISRAFSSIDTFYNLCKHLVTDRGIFVAMKGAQLEQDFLKEIIQKYDVTEVDVPFLHAKRHIIRIYATI